MSTDRQPRQLDPYSDYEGDSDDDAEEQGAFLLEGKIRAAISQCMQMGVSHRLGTICALLANVRMSRRYLVYINERSFPSMGSGPGNFYHWLCALESNVGRWTVAVNTALALANGTVNYVSTSAGLSLRHTRSVAAS